MSISEPIPSRRMDLTHKFARRHYDDLILLTTVGCEDAAALGASGSNRTVFFLNLLDCSSRVVSDPLFTSVLFMRVFSDVTGRCVRASNRHMLNKSVH